MARPKLLRCQNCASLTRPVPWPGRAGKTCPICREPWPTPEQTTTKRKQRRQEREVQAKLAEMERRDWLAYLTECRKLDRKPGVPRVVITSLAMYDRDDPGYPLGKGFPQGRTLRLDGESHREAWARTLRSDACAYCGRRGFSLGCPFAATGTLDHIVPQSKKVDALGGAHSWLNYTGACAGCNSRKGSKSLLLFMLARRGVRLVPGASPHASLPREVQSEAA